MFLVLLAVAFSATQVAAAETVPITSVDLHGMEQDWGNPQKNRSVGRQEISIGGKKFENGLGTHANSSLDINLAGNGDRFTAMVGVDDEVGTRGTVDFKVVGDGKTLWESGTLKGGEAAKSVSVDLHGVKLLELVADDAGDGIDSDHADWADAQIAMTEGKPVAAMPPPEPRVVLTPAPPQTPRINGAKIFGVRPGNPFLFTIAATGDRPMTFSADNLPDGLQLDPQTGQITGVLKDAGTYEVTFHAKNDLGEAMRPFKIVCGPTIGLTPAMGWNSWNCFASAVTEQKVKAAADAMVASGLINHGWTYINIDDFWEVNPRSSDPTLHGPERDAQGYIVPNPRFPDMKGLADYVHGKGLKIGLYSGPGPWTCGGCVASYQHENQDAESYAKWGFDYLKYDWCSYDGVVHGDHSLPALKKPYRVMRTALDRQNRDILYSMCQYGMGDVWEWGAEVGGNSWRTTGDINDSWRSMSGIGFSQNGHEKYAGPGHFNDPDMLVVGEVGWGPSLHPSRLSPNEQYTHISLWCLLSAPLLIGCDMTQLDPFTLGLLSNDEVLAVDQDPLAHQASRIAKDGEKEIWAKDLEDGSKAVGLFNRGRDETKVVVTREELGLSGDSKAYMVRDLWRQKNIGPLESQFETSVPRHGVVLIKVSAIKD